MCHSRNKPKSRPAIVITEELQFDIEQYWKTHKDNRQEVIAERLGITVSVVNRALNKYLSKK